MVKNEGDRSREIYSAAWTLISNGPQFFARDGLKQVAEEIPSRPIKALFWLVAQVTYICRPSSSSSSSSVSTDSTSEPDPGPGPSNPSEFNSDTASLLTGPRTLAQYRRLAAPDSPPLLSLPGALTTASQCMSTSAGSTSSQHPLPQSHSGQNLTTTSVHKPTAHDYYLLQKMEPHSIFLMIALGDRASLSAFGRLLKYLPADQIERYLARYHYEPWGDPFDYLEKTADNHAAYAATIVAYLRIYAGLMRDLPAWLASSIISPFLLFDCSKVVYRAIDNDTPDVLRMYSELWQLAIDKNLIGTGQSGSGIRASLHQAKVNFFLRMDRLDELISGNLRAGRCEVLAALRDMFVTMGVAGDRRLFFKWTMDKKEESCLIDLFYGLFKEGKAGAVDAYRDLIELAQAEPHARLIWHCIEIARLKYLRRPDPLSTLTIPYPTFAPHNQVYPSSSSSSAPGFSSATLSSGQIPGPLRPKRIIDVMRRSNFSGSSSSSPDQPGRYAETASHLASLPESERQLSREKKQKIS